MIFISSCHLFMTDGNVLLCYWSHHSLNNGTIKCSLQLYLLHCLLSTEKAARLKQAVEEARGDIEKYKKDREKTFQEQQAKVCVGVVAGEGGCGGG